ncbi:MAG: thymidylate kinase [Deltaproteobacteria bacterium]|nr:thymidylate kinase [Deltaproteobacteria bacterium]
MSGVFVVVDGLDGSGKGTQTARLERRLRADGRDVVLVDFPRYGAPSAYFIERYLRGEYGDLADVGAYRASLFYALDRFDASFEIRAALARGGIVISNRYVSANKGHQMAKLADRGERERFLAWLNHLEYELLGIPKPDLTILLHVPADVGFDLVAGKDERAYLRGKARDIHEDDRAHLRAAEAAYLALVTLDRSERWERVECMEDGRLLTVEEVEHRVWALVAPLVGRASGRRP